VPTQLISVWHDRLFQEDKLFLFTSSIEGCGTLIRINRQRFILLTFIIILLRELDVVDVFVLVVAKESGHQLMDPFLFFRRRFMEDACKIYDFVLWLVKIGNHMDQLRDDTECLLDILLYKADHLCFEVVFYRVDVCEGQAQTLHTGDALDGEDAAGEERSVGSAFDVFLGHVVFGDVLDQE